MDGASNARASDARTRARIRRSARTATGRPRPSAPHFAPAQDAKALGIAHATARRTTGSPATRISARKSTEHSPMFDALTPVFFAFLSHFIESHRSIFFYSPPFYITQFLPLLSPQSLGPNFFVKEPQLIDH